MTTIVKGDPKAPFSVANTLLSLIYIYISYIYILWVYIYIYIYIYILCLVSVFVLWHINFSWLFNTKAILVEGEWCFYLIHSWGDEQFHAFPKCIPPKVNLIVRLWFKLTHFYAMLTHLHSQMYAYNPEVPRYMWVCLYLFVTFNNHLTTRCAGVTCTFLSPRRLACKLKSYFCIFYLLKHEKQHDTINYE